MLFGIAAFLAAPRAEAHALLVVADPSDGESLTGSPRAVTLSFTEEPDPKLSSVRVLDTSGGARERGPLVAVDGRPRSLRIDLNQLDHGVYTVTWRVVSRVDGHFTSGAFAFGVQVSPAEIEAAGVAPSRTPPLSPLESAGRLFLYAGFVLLVGAAWVGAFVVRDAAPRTLLLGGWATAMPGLLVLGLAQHSASGAGVGAFLGSPIGRALIGRGVVLVIVGAALLSSARTARILVLGAAVAGIGVHVSAGHAGTGSLAFVKVATQLVHFSAVAVWIGGLAALLVAVRGAPDDQKARAVRRFSTVAGIMLAIVAGTGTARAVAEVGSWNGLFGTGYGRLVIVKIVLIAIIAALAARNRWWNVPRGADGVPALRRTSRFELAAAGVVLVVTSVLATLVPARSASLAEPASLTLEGSDFARSVLVRLAITPGYPGGNQFLADVEPQRGDARVDGVTLRLSSDDAGIRAATLQLRRTGERWRARGAIVAVQGVWRVVVVVDRGAESTEVPLIFHTRCRAETPTTDGRPRIYDIEISGGNSAQAYIDPGRPGRNEVHFTFFDGQGKELPMADDPVVEGFRGRSRTLDVRRFSPGHFVAGASLDEGRWIFSFDGSTSDGERVSVCFSDEI